MPRAGAGPAHLALQLPDVFACLALMLIQQVVTLEGGGLGGERRMVEECEHEHGLLRGAQGHWQQQAAALVRRHGGGGGGALAGPSAQRRRRQRHGQQCGLASAARVGQRLHSATRSTGPGSMHADRAAGPPRLRTCTASCTFSSANWMSSC